ncbi:hypothetical protein THAOC_20959, partial [Thalassiosira oceanica]
ESRVRRADDPDRGPVAVADPPDDAAAAGRDRRAPVLPLVSVPAVHRRLSRLGVEEGVEDAKVVDGRHGADPPGRRRRGGRTSPHAAPRRSRSTGRSPGRSVPARSATAPSRPRV